MRVSKFSIRTLVVVVTFIVICFNFISKQYRVAAELRAADAQIYYRYQYDDWDDPERYSLNHEAETPSFVGLAGPDFGSTIVNVSLSGSKDPSRVAQLCSQLPNIRLLAIQDCHLSDGDVRRLTGLKRLHGLYLRGTSITDASVTILKKFRGLHVLNVTETTLSEEALADLRRSLRNTTIHSGDRIRAGF